MLTTDIYQELAMLCDPARYQWDHDAHRKNVMPQDQEEGQLYPVWPTGDEARQKLSGKRYREHHAYDYMGYSWDGAQYQPIIARFIGEARIEPQRVVLEDDRVLGLEVRY